MGRTQAIFLTWTTYGTWLRGDMRGWVDEGRVLPADPVIEAADRARMKHPIFTFRAQDLFAVGQAIGDSLVTRMNLTVLALTMQTWHVHLVVGATSKPLPDIVKCAKDAARWHLRMGQPLWTDKYDKRFCFNDASTWARVAYTERHNLRLGWTERPWPFIKGLVSAGPTSPPGVFTRG
jgi:hypothetical protein